MIKQIATQVISINDRIKYSNEPLTDSFLLDRQDYINKNSYKNEYRDEFLNIIDRIIL